MALTTLANVKEYLGIPTADTSLDALLTNLIDRLSEFVEAWCNRKFLQATYTDEYHDGDGVSGVVFLNHYPIISVTSLYDDPERLFAASTLIASSDYVVYKDQGYLRLTAKGGIFNKGVQNIKVTYSAGYATAPKDVENACIMLVSFIMSKRKREGVEKEELPQGGYTFLEAEMPAPVRATLLKYKRYPL